LPPVIINDAITSVYSVIAVWIPVTVVPTSLATVAIDTFITALSSVIRNCPAASVSRTTPVALVRRTDVSPTWQSQQEHGIPRYSANLWCGDGDRAAEG
jgi:hypothetical protein